MSMFTADWWGLYTHRKGAEDAARGITQSLVFHVGNACDRMKSRVSFTATEAAIEVQSEMITVFKSYPAYGACDANARWALNMFLKEKFNTEVG